MEASLQTRAQELREDPEKVRVLAYLDDIVLVVPAALAGDAQDIAMTTLAPFGLALASTKTQAWSPQTPCPSCLTAQWRMDGITVVGTPIGPPGQETEGPYDDDGHRVELGTADYERHQTEALAERAAVLLDRLAQLPQQASPHQPGAQGAALLLRMSGLGLITHALRTTPPSATAQACKRFDDAVIASYVRICELAPPSPAQRTQLSLPMRYGGRGLRSQLETREVAWVASWTQGLPEILARSGVGSLANVATCPSPWRPNAAQRV